MLEKLEIKNIKPIQDMSLSLIQFTLLVGRNNTGKTTTLESIAWGYTPKRLQAIQTYPLQDIIHRDSETASIALRGDTTQHVQFERPSKEEIITCLQKQIEQREDIAEVLELNTAIVKQNIRSLPQEILSKLGQCILRVHNESIKNGPTHLLSQQEYDMLTETLFKDTSLATENKNLPRSIVTQQLLFNPTDTRKENTVTYVRDFASVQKHIQNTTENKNVLRSVEEALKETVLPTLDRIYIGEGGIQDIGYESGRITNFNLLGDGLKSMILLLYEIHKETSQDLVLLDEPGTHMHAGYVREFVKMLISYGKQSDTQFIISTHNQYIIEQFITLNGAYLTYLENTFSLQRLESFQNTIISTKETYTEAQNSYKDLLLDLRGV